MSFSGFGLHPQLLRAIEQMGFAQPTPIQAGAIPPGVAGRDVLACAMTGSGKTAAFLLPILQRLIERPRGTTRALVLTPTRELAAQIEQHLQQLAAFSGVTGAAVFGGVAMGPQEAAFRRGVDIIIATPGRLLDHLKQPYARFDALEVLVLDEADRMLDMGFLPDIKRVLRQLPTDRQTMFFSATMPAPIVGLSREMLRQPAAIDLERRAAPATGIHQALYPVREDLKPALFLELLRRGTLADVIVFTRTKHRANRLAEILERGGVNVARIHGNRSQAQRTLALEGFKKGEYQVLVATDIVARGIDVEELSHVVNFDVPHVPEDYIHRVGRTARAEATGDAFTFVSREEEGDLRAIERAIGRTLPRLTVEGFDYAQRAAERFEVPAHERIAAIRARRAEERRRAQEKLTRKTQREGEEQARREEKLAAKAARRAGSRAAGPSARQGAAPTTPSRTSAPTSHPVHAHAAAAHARHTPAPEPYRDEPRVTDGSEREAREAPPRTRGQRSAPAPTAAERVERERIERERVRGAWSPMRDQDGERPTRERAADRGRATRDERGREPGADRTRVEGRAAARHDGARREQRRERDGAPRERRPTPRRVESVHEPATSAPRAPQHPAASADETSEGARRRRRGRRGGRGRKRATTPNPEE